MDEISAMPENIRNLLSQKQELSHIRFLTEYPPVTKAVPLDRITVAVGIKKIEIADSFSEEPEVLEENEYCRLAVVTLRFSIHSPYSLGGAACHGAFADIIDCLTFDSGLRITSSGCDNIVEDRQTDALVLRAYAAVEANLCPADTTGMHFPSFEDKTLLCGSHISDESIHLSPSQQTFLGEPFVTGSYFGTGTASRTFSLGFEPHAVMLVAGDMPFFIAEQGVNRIYSALAVPDAGSLGLSLTSNGFAVRNGSSHDAFGARPSLNESGVIYHYAALR